MQDFSNQNSNFSPHPELLKAIIAAGILANQNFIPKSWGINANDSFKESLELQRLARCTERAYNAIFENNIGEIDDEFNEKIDNLFKSLSWNTEQQDEFFQCITPQTTLNNLDNDQKVDCIKYLQLYIEVTDLIKDLDWSGKEERMYFNYHHPGKTREKLDIAELQDFLEYLQVFETIDMRVDDLELSIDVLQKEMQKTYGVKKRVQLNLEQLQDFLESIEISAIPY